MDQFIKEIKKLMSEINQECFENKLVFNFPVKISNSGKSAGCVIVDNFYGYIKVMKISKNYDWNHFDLKNVIAHELIHVYECQVLKKLPSHGYDFILKMNQINNNPNYKITVRHSMKTTKKQKETKIPYILSENLDKIVFVTKSLLNKTSNDKIKIIFGENYQIGVINSNKINKRFSIARKLQYTYKTNIQKLSELGILSHKQKEF